MVRICSMLWQVPASAKGSRSVANPGIDAGDEDARIAFSRSLFDAFDVLVGDHLPRDTAARPGAEPTTSMPAAQELADVGHRLLEPDVAHRAVDDAVGLGGDDRVEVVGGRDAGRRRRGRRARRRPCRPSRRSRHPDRRSARSAGRRSAARSASLPQLPVPMSATRMAMPIHVMADARSMRSSRIGTGSSS